MAAAAASSTPGGQFNTYALSWTPTTLTTYFNGVPCFTDTYGPHVKSPDTPPEPFNQPFFFNLTAAMGMGANAPSNDTPYPGHHQSRLGPGLAVRLKPRHGDSRPRSAEESPGPVVTSGAVEFSKELHDDIAAGDITVSFRLWRRAQAKVGGRYRVGRVEIEVDAMDLVPFASITKADVRRAGEIDKEALRQRAAHAGPIADDTELYRIAFHVIRELG